MRETNPKKPFKLNTTLFTFSRCSTSEYKALANSIVKLFLTEQLDSYFAYNDRKFKGKLFDSYTRYRVVIRKAGIVGYLINKRVMSADRDESVNDSNFIDTEFIKIEPEEFL